MCVDRIDIEIHQSISEETFFDETPIVFPFDSSFSRNAIPTSLTVTLPYKVDATESGIMNAD